MRATLILLFVALGFQASAETRAICSVTGTHFLDGAELTEQSDLVELCTYNIMKKLYL